MLSFHSIRKIYVREYFTGVPISTVILAFHHFLSLWRVCSYLILPSDTLLNSSEARLPTQLLISIVKLPQPWSWMNSASCSSTKGMACSLIVFHTQFHMQLRILLRLDILTQVRWEHCKHAQPLQQVFRHILIGEHLIYLNLLTFDGCDGNGNADTG